MLEFREAQAQKSDLPPFKVLGNEPLLELAKKKPSNLVELETGKVLSPRQAARYGKTLLREIERALALPEKDLPVYPRKEKPDWPASVRRRVKALKAWRDKRAKDLGLDPGVLMNNALINAVALKNPRSLKEKEEIPGMKGWLKDHFGQEILAAQTMS